MRFAGETSGCGRTAMCIDRGLEPELRGRRAGLPGGGGPWSRTAVSRKALHKQRRQQKDLALGYAHQFRPLEAPEATLPLRIRSPPLAYGHRGENGPLFWLLHAAEWHTSQTGELAKERDACARTMGAGPLPVWGALPRRPYRPGDGVPDRHMWRLRVGARCGSLEAGEAARLGSPIIFVVTRALSRSHTSGCYSEQLRGAQLLLHHL